MFIKLVRPIYRWWYRKYPPEMVSYWKTKESVMAKLTDSADGSRVMHMQGEKYPFPGYPRGHILFKTLSPIKHHIKNKIFNESWYELEEGKLEEDIIERIKKEALPYVFDLGEKARYDMLPPERMSPAVREIWRALSVVEEKSNPSRRDKVRRLKEIICFIFQEDDAYRFRFQYMAGFFNPNSWWRKLLRRNPIKDFDLALSLLEHAEVIGDMKERQRLLRRILIFVLRDQGIRECFDQMCKELDWKKLKLSKADKYFFRGKYFKVDYPLYDY